jgi:thiol-disulfide isomerase/thioredoxin
MSLRLATSCFVSLLFVGICLPVEGRNYQSQNPDRPGVPLSGSLTPQELLGRAIEQAERGDLGVAFLKAKDARSLAGLNGSASSTFVVDYLNTLLTLIELADENQRIAIINEAIAACDAAAGRAELSGFGNPESAYYFMLAVNRLAEAALPLSEPTCVALKLKQGKIAGNLLANPAFPADGRGSLAQPLVDLAAGYARRNDYPEVVRAIEQACQLGYCEFDSILASSHFQSLENRAAFQEFLAGRESEYQKQTRDWAVREIQNFQPFRFNFHIDSLTGGSLELNDYRGKVLVVDFWATWCPPCRQGLPHLQQLHREYRKEGVQILGIAMDSPDEPYVALDNIRDFLFNQQITFPCGLGTTDLVNRLRGDLKYPTTLFIDRSGNVRYLATGYQDYAKLQALTEVLINEKQPVSWFQLD